MDVKLYVASEQHFEHAQYICDLIADAAKKRGTGIAKRNPEYIKQKMKEGKAVIAIADNNAAGFCYIETWSHNKYVANSGLIVNPEFRKTGLAKKIKSKILQLSQQKYPNAKVFGITTSLAVMKINSDLGYKPVTFSQLTDDEKFWQGCKGCVNYDILTRTNKQHCLCTGMLYEKPVTVSVKKDSKKNRWVAFQRFLKLRQIKLIKKLKNQSSKNIN